MTLPQLRFLSVGGHASVTGAERRLAYWDWSGPQLGEPAHVVICVHGLTRQGRDFDVLARALSASARVLAVDVAGRGHSDWLSDPMGYQVSTYVQDLALLIECTRSKWPHAVIDWVGTSMGGLIGMAIASQPRLAPRRLVINDVGPVLEWGALQRIGSYVGRNPSFANEGDAIGYLASLSEGFGPHTPEQWRQLSLPMLRKRDGQICLHYDPSIAVPFRAMTQGADEAMLRRTVKDGDVVLWGLYDAIRSPTLLIRGADSDLLTRETALQMTARGPKARRVEFTGVGHAPTLIQDDQVAAVRDFLLAS